ncbi:MAG: hypothetical protein ACI965_000847 [Paraglaciecola sp.]|jgi:hypothetical protein
MAQPAEHPNYLFADHPHPLYINFSDYGDADNFLEESSQLRESLQTRPSK